MATELGEAFVTIGARFGPLGRSLRVAESLVAGTARRISSTLSAAFTLPFKAAALPFKALFGAETIAGLKHLAGLRGVGLAGGIGVAVKQFADFQTELALVATMLDERTMPLLGEFGEAMQDLSVEFGQSTDVLAKGLFDILSASIPAAKAIEVLRVATIGAVGGFTTTAISADALTTVLNAYQLSADRATDVSDVLFGMVKRGKFTFEQLAQSIGQAAPMAALAGISLQELGAALSTATRATGNIAEATTGLRALLQALIDPQDKAAQMARQLGIDMSVARVRTEGLAAILEDLSKANLRAQVTLGGSIRSFSLLGPLLLNVQGFQEDLNLLMNAGGRAAEAYGKVVNTLGVRFKQFKERVTVALVAIGAFSVKVWDRVATDMRAVWAAVEDDVRTALDRIGGLMAAWLGPAASWAVEFSQLWDRVLERLVTVDIPIRKMVLVAQSGFQGIGKAFDWLTAVAGVAGRNILHIVELLGRGIVGVVQSVGRIIANLLARGMQQLATAFNDVARQLSGGGFASVFRGMFVGFKDVAKGLRDTFLKLSGVPWLDVPIGEALAAAWGKPLEGITEELATQLKELGFTAQQIAGMDVWQKLRNTFEDVPRFPIEQFGADIQEAFGKLDLLAQKRIAALHARIRQRGGIWPVEEIQNLIKAMRARDLPAVGALVPPAPVAVAAARISPVAAPRALIASERFGLFVGRRESQVDRLIRLSEQQLRELVAIRIAAAEANPI